MKKIFIICSVRNTTDKYKKKLEEYVKKLEDDGNIVHLPHRDTNQNNNENDICLQNLTNINNSDEVHVFYNSLSQGTHFDLGVTFALNKPIVIVENDIIIDEKKSFSRMLLNWNDNLIYVKFDDNIYKFPKELTDIKNIIEEFKILLSYKDEGGDVKFFEPTNTLALNNAFKFIHEYSTKLYFKFNKILITPCINIFSDGTISVDLEKDKASFLIIFSKNGTSSYYGGISIGYSSYDDICKGFNDETNNINIEKFLKNYF
jgi:nucleoside 2-deoxyribosyltransferase